MFRRIIFSQFIMLVGITGCGKGERGYPGRPGKTGPQGEDGKTKIVITNNNAPDNPGVTGATGPMGPTGPHGRDGEPGPRGLNGEPGTPGPAGANGANGEPGANGENGLPGANGENAMMFDKRYRCAFRHYDCLTEYYIVTTARNNRFVTLETSGGGELKSTAQRIYFANDDSLDRSPIVNDYYLAEVNANISEAIFKRRDNGQLFAMPCREIGFGNEQAE